MALGYGDSRVGGAALVSINEEHSEPLLALGDDGSNASVVVRW